MSHVVVSNLAYAHPGGELLFAGVSFKIAPRRHVGLVGANGVGKSTLFRVLAGELPADEGTVDIGPFGYMAQDVGVRADGRRVRELLLAAAPARLRDAGRRMLAAERDLAAGADLAGAGMRLGEAIGDWSELGGYELEGRWDASCRRIVGSGLDEVGPRATTQLSGGERKRLMLDVLFESDAAVLLLDEPVNFLDVPAKLDPEARIAASKQTIMLISHDRDLLGAATNTILTLEANETWTHGGSYRTYPEARAGCSRTTGRYTRYPTPSRPLRLSPRPSALPRRGWRSGSRPPSALDSRYVAARAPSSRAARTKNEPSSSVVTVD